MCHNLLKIVDDDVVGVVIVVGGLVVIVVVMLVVDHRNLTVKSGQNQVRNC